MPLLDEVRASCAKIAMQAQHVRIDDGAVEQIASRVGEIPSPALDSRCHYLEGEPADVADFLLTLDAINFGSGWFPSLRKASLDGRPLSGYFTVALALSEHVRAHGVPSNAWLRQAGARELASILGQDPASELMSLYAQALRELGRFLRDRRALDLVEASRGSAERLAEALVSGMPMFADHGFYKRAQIVASDLALAGVASFEDLDKLTIFADNLVPHVLRCDGVLVYDDALANRIDAGEILPLGGAELEIRGCAVNACERISKRTGVPARRLDNWLWSRGQASEYKAKPRHRCRCVFY